MTFFDPLIFLPSHNPILQSILAFLYLGPLALLSNMVFWGSMGTLGLWVALKWKGEKPEITQAIDNGAEIIWDQVCTRLFV